VLSLPTPVLVSPCFDVVHVAYYAGIGGLTSISNAIRYDRDGVSDVSGGIGEGMAKTNHNFHRGLSS